jgi:hypothetical protein
VSQDRLELKEVKLGANVIEALGEGRPPKVKLLVSSRSLGEHGYSSKLCIHSG